MLSLFDSFYEDMVTYRAMLYLAISYNKYRLIILISKDEL